jgi:ribosomal protein S1
MIERTKEKWEELKNKLEKGQILSGKVVKVERYGVFVDIGEAFNAIVLAPQISKKEKITVEDYPKKGEFIEGVILDFSDDQNIDYDFAYVSISIKALPPDFYD